MDKKKLNIDNTLYGVIDPEQCWRNRGTALDNNIAEKKNKAIEFVRLGDCFFYGKNNIEIGC